MRAIDVPGAGQENDDDERERERAEDPHVAPAHPGRPEREHDDRERPQSELTGQLAETEHDTEPDR